MSKTSIPFSAPDISAVARSLRDQLGDSDHKPGHVELLNMLAHSIGHRNFQSLRAQAALQEQPAIALPVVQTDFALVQKLMKYFDARGNLLRWPTKASHREPCLWVVWSKLPPRQTWPETELNQRLRACHQFGDHALLRRELCDRGMVSRTPDGKEYRRVERKPPAESAELIRAFRRAS